MRQLAVFASLLVGVGVSAEAPRGRAFWVQLKDAKFALPSAVSRAEVLRDAVTLVDEPDPVLRDDVGYGLALQWVYREQALSDAELTSFTKTLLARLGDTKRGVLGRSFSALSLSMVAAAETKSPRLDAASWAALVEAACVELERESDLRGYDEKLGWIHATAHTADLLKFLARDARLTEAQQRRIVSALKARLERGDTFAWGEDERLAAVVRSIALRKDVAKDVFEPWVGALPGRWKALWAQPRLNALEFKRLNGTKQVLRAVVVTLPEADASAQRFSAVLGDLM